MRHTVELRDAQTGYQAILALWHVIKPLLLSGHHLIITLRESTRSLDQNAKFHALCGDVAKSGIQWAGRKRTAKEWKVLFVSGHAIATGEGAEIVPGLESEFINLRESTALMSVKRSSSLIEYTLAWCATHDVELRDFARDWPEGAAKRRQEEVAA